MSTQGTVTARTDAGMLALWCASTFEGIADYDAWETRVEDRIEEAIAHGEFVPVNIRSDGAFGVRVTVAPNGLSARERSCAVTESEPYLLDVSRGEVCLSGIEGIGDRDNAALRLQLPDGRYAVVVTLVAWDDEPASMGPDGTPADDALPDFVVRVAPEKGDETYRVQEQTFDPPQ
jgi:hypothetical protein